MSRVSGKPYFVYILWTPSAHRFYIGVSENPQQRLQQHNQRKSGWPARHRPWELVHQERYENYASARRREMELKRQKAGQQFYRLTALARQRFQAQGSPSEP
jgi:putative endonuclease